jgi:hypothetical protein
MMIKIASRKRARDLPDGTTIQQRLRDAHLEERAHAIALRWHLTVLDMLQSPRRPAPNARAEFYRELRRLKWSYERIGQLVGLNDSTVRAACVAGAPSEAR